MAGKGPSQNLIIDVSVLNEVIVFANSYRTEIAEKADTIRAICRRMQDEESLKGGDGEQIRNSFDVIGKGCNDLNTSAQYIVEVLNDRLEAAIKMRHGESLGDSVDTAAKAAKSVGVYKKD